MRAKISMIAVNMTADPSVRKPALEAPEPVELEFARDTLRETYGEHFAPGVRGDMKLENLLESKGADSLSELLRRGR